MIPAELVPTDLTKQELAAFLEDVHSKLVAIGHEFEDDIFGYRKHGSDATYQDGCQGPLCATAHRVYARSRRGSTPTPYWAAMEPVLIWYGQLVVSQLEAAEDAASKMRSQMRQDILWGHLNYNTNEKEHHAV